MGRNKDAKVSKKSTGSSFGKIDSRAPTFDSLIAQFQGLVERNHHDDKETIKSIVSELGKKSENVHTALQLIRYLHQVKSSQLDEHVVIEFDGENERLWNTLSEELRELVSNAKKADFNMLEQIIEGLDKKQDQLARAKEVFQEVSVSTESTEVTSEFTQRKCNIVVLRSEKPVIENVQCTVDVNHKDSKQESNIDPERSFEETDCLLSEVENVYSDSDKSVPSMDSQIDSPNKDSILQHEVNRMLKDVSKLIRREPEIDNLSEVVQSMQDRFHQEQLKKVFSLTAIEAKEKMNTKLTLNLASMQDELNKTVEENKYLSEEIDTLKSILKKERKSKANETKKIKKDIAAVRLENKQLLQRLTDTSATDESFASSNLTEEFALKPQDSTLEFRIAELQRSSESLQNRYEDVCNKLEASEKLLEVQQDINSRITASSVETRQKHSSEVSALEEIIKTMKTAASQQEKELLRIQQLERTKTDVLINFMEEEKQEIREKCDSLKLELTNTQKAIKEQKAEAKRHFENEIWKMKKAAKLAERRNSSASNSSKSSNSSTANDGDEVQQLITELATLQALLLVKSDRPSETIFKVNHLLEIAIETVKQMTIKNEKCEIALAESLSKHELKDQALDALAKMQEEKSNEYEAALKSERSKYEYLQKVIEENMEDEAVSAKRWKDLHEQEKLLEANQIQYKKDSEEFAKRTVSSEMENVKLRQELDSLQKNIDQKNLDINMLSEENNLLQVNVQTITKQLEDVLSPRKDRTAQLESRLETIQSSAKAQQKRLEDDLVSARAQLKFLSKQNGELQLTNLQLQKKSALADELTMSLAEKTVKFEESEESISELKRTVSQLEDENRSLILVNAEERAGLVTELITTKEKLKECQSIASLQAKNLEQIQSLEEELKSTKKILEGRQNSHGAMQVPEQVTGCDRSIINEMFPEMDPLLRQMVHILAQNQNYLYGILGIVFYVILIHLYIFL
ncbi:hypothetical protein L5515_001501 [Caenorhabditis briggsae]|uniref:Uncharacterized protein n=1 Tax=Caenorhabditis briggsae TaxID=6238 RepID=A0AAE9J3I7_CAEBR|nr:hypothetical protein L5515_001501 [Caenorhabditis briggsae]